MTRDVRLRYRWGVGIGLLIAACAAVACEEHRAGLKAQESDPGPTMCEDGDGDGFGLGCAEGPDCDDDDANVASECLCDDAPTPGCECDDEGAVADCGRVHERVGQQMICGQGVTTCSDGKWRECIINSAISLQPPLKMQNLGGPSECASNPCDPNCTTFVDTPTNLPLPADGGLTASDAGVTLVGDGGTGGPVVGGGFGCTGGTYPANTGACAHHVCETGAKLDPTCDQKPGGTSTVAVFSDSFSAGNAQGWVLDSTWEIGSAVTSTGHTTGSADPSADTTTTTTDDGIAGTVLGGNIGGNITLFSDEFTNLNSWTETGDGDWNTENISSSSGYPGSASGSPAAHSDNCDNSCTITLTGAVNLSGQTAATLELLRFLDNTLDAGEYLRLEAYNGSSWVQLANWVGQTHDDDVWHSETFNLAGYLVPGFKIRFVTKQSDTNEHVRVDDVQITTPPANVTRWMTSPAFDGTVANGALSLSFRRWLNVEAASSRAAMLEVYNGTTWVNLYTNTSAVSETSWSTQTFDLTAHKNAAMKLRFGWTGAATSKVSGWNVDDVVITGTHEIPPTGQCVSKVCAKDPTCCSTSWHAGCLLYIEDECDITCSLDTSTDKCVACYNDPTETVDYDGDGVSRADGDCLECNAKVSPKAWDIPGNDYDDDCDGTADNESSDCDGALAPGGDAAAHAKAIGLCRTASGDRWGVTSASFMRANGTTACTDAKQYYIVKDFGSGNTPTAGSQMVAYSSGTARDSSDTGYVMPNGNGYNAGTSSTPAYSIPPAAGCNAGTEGKDSCGLKVTIRAPTNVQSFSFNFNFFTSEYPEWLCTSYNDAFVAYYLGSANTKSDKNISFDKQGNPVTVNNGLFDIPAGWPPPATGTHPKLNGTGFDGVCGNNHTGSSYKPNSICGGSTGWLVTTAPVTAGEEITLHFSIWDTGDNQWDSTVLIDNFAWSAAPASIETGEYEPGSAGGVPLKAASFTRDYDATGLCEEHQLPVWSLWSWSATTPGDSKIQFFVKTATSKAGLDSAQEDPLVFSNPPGPSAKAGQNAVAQAGSPSTATGSVYVEEAWKNNARALNNNFVRVRSYLVPTSDGLSAPVLQSWNLQLSCKDAE